jgi:hypothetical protein
LVSIVPRTFTAKAAELPHRLRECVLDARTVGDVDVEVVRATWAPASRGLGDRAALRVAHVHADDVRAGAHVRTQRGFAHAARRAGDDDSLAADVHRELSGNRHHALRALSARLLIVRQSCT